MNSILPILDFIIFNTKKKYTTTNTSLVSNIIIENQDNNFNEFNGWKFWNDCSSYFN